MGCGIAHVCAVSGFDVYLADISTEALERALSTLTDSLEHQVSKSKISEATRTAALDRISTGTGLALFSECDLVIEAVTENEEIKRQILKSLVSHLKPEALIATCSSSIPITRLAARTDRPQKFMGMHFMNPVPPIQLVELIRGIATDDETFEAVQELTGKLEDRCKGRGLPRLHRQPYIAADDQRSSLRPVRGHRLCRDDRCGDEAGRQPSDGAAGIGRFHRPGYLLRSYDSPLRRAGR